MSQRKHYDVGLKDVLINAVTYLIFFHCAVAAAIFALALIIAGLALMIVLPLLSGWLIIHGIHASNYWLIALGTAIVADFIWMAIKFSGYIQYRFVKRWPDWRTKETSNR